TSRLASMRRRERQAQTLAQARGLAGAAAEALDQPVRIRVRCHRLELLRGGVGLVDPACQRVGGGKPGPAARIAGIEAGRAEETLDRLMMAVELEFGAAHELEPVAHIWVARAQPDRIVQVLETF